MRCLYPIIILFFRLYQSWSVPLQVLLLFFCCVQLFTTSTGTTNKSGISSFLFCFVLPAAYSIIVICDVFCTSSIILAVYILCWYYCCCCCTCSCCYYLTRCILFLSFRCFDISSYSLSYTMRPINLVVLLLPLLSIHCSETTLDTLPRMHYYFEMIWPNHHQVLYHET